MFVEEKKVVVDTYSATTYQVLRIFLGVLFGIDSIRAKQKILATAKPLQAWKRFFGLVASRPVCDSNVFWANTGVCEFAGRKWIFYTTCSLRVFLFDPKEQILVFIHDSSSDLKSCVEALVGEKVEPPELIINILSNVSCKDVVRDASGYRRQVMLVCYVRYLSDVYQMLHKSRLCIVDRNVYDPEDDDSDSWRRFNKGKRYRPSEQCFVQLESIL